jgi:streptogramin lyase
VGDGTRIWYLDDANHVNALHPATGELFAQIASLPASANIGRLATSPNHVYLSDAVVGVLYVLTIDSEQLRSVRLPAVSVATAMVASPDERLWLGTPGSGLVSYDPRTNRVETIAAGQNLSALASDALGRIWFATRERQALDLYDPLTAQITELAFAHAGAITALAVDRSGAVWAGTDTGQVLAMRNGSVEFTSGLPAGIDSFVLDQEGAAWYVSLGSDLSSGRAASATGPRRSPLGSSGPIFDSLGRTWQADRSADGFYVTLPDGSR